MMRGTVPDPARLTELLETLQRARVQLAQLRATAPRSQQETGASADVLAALEDYAAALMAANRPLPYALRDELRLRRALRSAPYRR